MSKLITYVWYLLAQVKRCHMWTKPGLGLYHLMGMWKKVENNAQSFASSSSQVMVVLCRERLWTSKRSSYSWSALFSILSKTHHTHFMLGGSYHKKSFTCIWRRMHTKTADLLQGHRSIDCHRHRREEQGGGCQGQQALEVPGVRQVQEHRWIQESLEVRADPFLGFLAFPGRESIGHGKAQIDESKQTGMIDNVCILYSRKFSSGI